MKQLTVLVAVAGVLAGCGPVLSTANIRDAEIQIEAARTADAETLAPYEWTVANLYIHKAREEVAYSNYQQGVKFAERASLCANAARMKATNQDDEAAKTTIDECQSRDAPVKNADASKKK